MQANRTVRVKKMGVRILEQASGRMAAGDLTVRTLPSMAGRSDELASMATAFDRMTERIELLLTTERQMLADISHELYLQGL
jgi:methyl-accepting chemotaxis protein